MCRNFLSRVLDHIWYFLGGLGKGFTGCGLCRSCVDIAADASSCRHKDSISGRHVAEREGSKVYPRDPNGPMVLFVCLDP